MNMIQTSIQTWKNSFNYSDRSSRREFWIFGLLNIVIIVILCVPMALSVDAVTGDRFSTVFSVFRRVNIAFNRSVRKTIP